MIAGLIATLASGLFAGAALYINVVEHPARISCGTAEALREWRPSYKRATVMQVPLAVVATVAALIAWLTEGGALWIASAVLMTANIPFTLLVIFPTNSFLLSPAAESDLQAAAASLNRWNRLHAVRTVLSIVAFFLAGAAMSSGREPSAPAPPGMVRIPAGTFRMGTIDGPSHETPVHEVEVRSFFIDRTEVTVEDFARFVAATGYKTEAESIGWSGVFDPDQRRWLAVKGATWRNPDGPAAPPAASHEPVTQVSWNDAQAYARWAGKRLPTEAEWEYAARGGVDQAPYVWGHRLRPDGRPVANWWQGRFPEADTGEDGFRGRAPVGRFEPNGFGLVDMSGNVWEWCTDWYADSYYAESPRQSPSGPAAGTERVMRGGSWMCSENHCTNYRPGARSKATPDTGLNNTGFRLVRDVNAGGVE